MTNTTTPTTATATKPTCFVIQPSQDARLDRLYNELFRPAIAEAELTPYRPAVAPGQQPALEAVVAQIRSASACFADLTEESPYTWFALGCAAVLGKPICLVASASAGEKRTFAAAYPGTIFYPALPLPSDYQRLQQQITTQLLLVPGPNEVHEASPAVVVAAPLAELLKPETLTAEPSAAAAEATMIEVPSAPGNEAGYEPIHLAVADIRVHELLALSIIARETSPRGTTLRALAMEMHKHGAAQATSLSLNGLCRKRLVDRKLMTIEGDGDNHSEDCLFLSAAGRDWIEVHKLDLSFTPPPLDADPASLMDLIHAL